METIKVLLLICATSMPRGDCQRDTALDVIAGPPVVDEIACGLMGQAYLAASGIGRRLGEGEYLKIICTQDTMLGSVAPLPDDALTAAPAGPKVRPRPPVAGLECLRACGNADRRAVNPAARRR